MISPDRTTLAVGCFIFLVLLNFYQKPVRDLIKNSSATEDQEDKSPDLKRDEQPTPTVKPTFETGTMKFPVKSYFANVMFQLFGKEGILEKGGFSRSGYIHRNGSASIILLGSFGNRSMFLHEVLKAKNSSINEGALALVVHLFFTTEAFQGLTRWLRQEIYSGFVNEYDPCSPIVKITYYCCTMVASPFLGPKFGRLRVDID